MIKSAFFCDKQIKTSAEAHSAGFTLFSLSAVWWTQAKFCVYGHITAESSKIESPVPTLGCNLEMYGQSLYFNKTVLYDYLTFCGYFLKKKKSLWKRFLFYFTSAVDSQPISWLSVWGIAYFLVGSSRALWKALMKSAATERSATDWWRFKSDSCDVAASYSRMFSFRMWSKEQSAVNSQFSSITSVGFFAMGLSGRICTETTEDVHTYSEKGIISSSLLLPKYIFTHLSMICKWVWFGEIITGGHLFLRGLSRTC